MTSTHYEPTIDECIETVAYEFARRLLKLRLDMAWPKYHAQRLGLEITVSENADRAEITAHVGSSYSDQVTVKGATLSAVMDEVYRRLNYQDRAEAQIQSSLKRLAPPPLAQEEQS